MKNTLGLLASLFLLGLAAAVPADEEEAERPVPQSLDELRAAITEVMEEYDVPAVGIAMVDATGPVSSTIAIPTAGTSCSSMTSVIAARSSSSDCGTGRSSSSASASAGATRPSRNRLASRQRAFFM